MLYVNFNLNIFKGNENVESAKHKKDDKVNSTVDASYVEDDD
jgi:hypothetical protein